MKIFKKVLLGSLAALTTLSFVSCDKDDNDPVVDNGGNTGGNENGGNTGGNENGGNTNVKNPFTKENYANGARSYVAASYEERTEILGILEKYAFENSLTGLTLYGNGGYAMYSPDIVKGTNTYIPGYGFGILTEGEITKDLAGETNPAYARYYHSYQTEDPKTINYMNDKGSVVGDLNSYTAGSYFTTFMNEDKDGYEWGPALAKSERPIAMNADANGLATKYRIEVKVGSEFKYNTNSTTFASYNNREVALEDYITPFKMLFTKSYGMARAADNLINAGSFKGSKAYYDGTAGGFNQELWDQVGIKAVTEGGKNYLEFEFNIPANTFYAMYYLSSALYAPVPEQFIKDLGNGDFAAGVAVYGNSTDSGLTPVDTFLSTGAYTLESWEADKQIVFKRNPNYSEGANRYKIAGVHFNILKAAATDNHAVINEFLANKLHASGIPSDMLDEYKNDPRTTTTTDSSTFKLNLNTCTPEVWEKLFGQNGTITKTTNVEDYWDCEPAMANKNFVAGLNYAINRNDFAASLGRTPSCNYFGSSYLSDPENGVSYNSTEAHKNAVASLLEGTQNGYNLEFAKTSFKKASEELIASGAYKAGDTIKLEIAWMYPDDESEYHNVVAKYFEDAFNACGGGLTLDCEFWVGALWSDVYYEKMMVGQFDIGFGSINGNSLNPLNFLEVLKSDNSSGFTLNWGTDTNVVSEDLYYDGMYWSFDSLWEAADKGGYFKDGLVSPAFTAPKEATNVTVNADGSAVIVIDTTIASVEGVEFAIDDVVIYGVNDTTNYSDYAEESVKATVTQDKGKFTINVSADVFAKYKDKGTKGIDIYYTLTVCGIDSSSYASVDFKLPTA